MEGPGAMRMRPLPLNNEVTKADADGNASRSLRRTLKETFGKTLRDNVSEEELFVAVLKEKMQGTQGEFASRQFNRILSNNIENAKKSGKVSYEEVGNASVKALIDAQLISKEDARALKREAFNAAQLDDNKSLLYDGKGSGIDPTISVAPVRKAVFLAANYLKGAKGVGGA